MGADRRWQLGNCQVPAASMAAGCTYCIASHTAAARARGMTEAQFGELLAVVGMAAETNRLAEALRVPVDAAFE